MTAIHEGRRATHEALPERVLRKGFCRPVRSKYTHDLCGKITAISLECAETFAACPRYYTHTYCDECGGYYPVSEFVWLFSQDRVGA